MAKTMRAARKTKKTVCLWPAAKNNAKTMQNQFIACPVNSQFTHNCVGVPQPLCVWSEQGLEESVNYISHSTVEIFIILSSFSIMDMHEAQLSATK